MADSLAQNVKQPSGTKYTAVVLSKLIHWDFTLQIIVLLQHFTNTLMAKLWSELNKQWDGLVEWCAPTLP